MIHYYTPHNKMSTSCTESNTFPHNITELYDWIVQITPIRWLTHCIMNDTIHTQLTNPIESIDYCNTLNDSKSRSASPLNSSQHRIYSHDNLSKQRLNKKLTKKIKSQQRKQWSNTEIVLTMAVVCTVASCAVWSYRIIMEAIYTINKFYGNT